MASVTIHEVASKRQGIRYRLRYDYVDPASGKRERPWETLPPGTTKRQAEAAGRRGLAALDGGRAPVAAVATVGDLLADWLSTDARPRLEATTLDGYERTIRCHLLPAFGKLPLRGLSPVLVQRWEVAYRRDHGYRTVQLCHQRLRQACAYGVRMGMLPHNPLSTVRPPRSEPAPRQIWDANEATAFLLVAARGPYAPIWHFLLGTGVRRGEVLGLRWQDVDLARGTARIVQTIRPLPGGLITKKPKNPQSARTIPLSRDLAERLGRHRVIQAEQRLRLGAAWTDRDLVFASGDGRPIHPHNLRYAFVALVAQAGVRRITIHQLRHTAGTLALAAGASMEEIQRLLGHKRIATTADIYVKPGDEAMRVVAEALARALAT